VSYTIAARKLPYPLSETSSRSGEQVTIPADDVVLLHVKGEAK
jgi:hypothetical protein